MQDSVKLELVFSMPLLWLSLAFLSGILLAAIVSLPTETWLIIAGIALILAITRPFWLRISNRIFGTRYSAIPLPIPVLILAAMLGAARYQISLPDLSEASLIANFNDNERKIVITGVIAAFPDIRDTHTNLRIEAEAIHPYGTTTQRKDIHGTLQARIDQHSTLHYGDRITITGYLKTPPHHEDFSYRDYLARQGIYSYISSSKVSVLATDTGHPLLQAIYALKEKALNTVYQLWPDPEASLFSGILLGIETGIPEPVQEDFKNTGTSHVIAISGFNITIVAGLFASLFGRLLGPRKGALAAVLGISIYTVLVGAEAAVVRAAIMGGLSLFARQVGRRQHGLNALTFTAAVMSLFNPHTPWDIGFQLSFAATLGLVLYADPFARSFTRLMTLRFSKDRATKLAGPVGEYFLFTIAAQITTLPIMAYHFRRISLIAFIANPVILPVQPPIMTLGGAAVILGMIWLPLGKFVAVLAWPFVLFTIRAVEFFGEFAGGYLPLGELSIFWVILFYGILLTWTLGNSKLRERYVSLLPISIFAALGIGAVVIWRAALTAPDGRLHLIMLDVGSGDALLIQTPTGRFALINGGPSPNLLANGLGRRLPPFQREFDWLVIASPRATQLGALARNLERYPPSQVLWAGSRSTAWAADHLRENLTRLNIPVFTASDGQIFELGDGAFLEILTSGKQGVNLMLSWNHFHALLPLGANSEELENLNIGQVDVLVLADQGYAPLHPPGWIASLGPRLVLLSVAADDRDGRPDLETLDALGGYTLLRTDQHGWIEVTTDGVQMWVTVENP